MNDYWVYRWIDKHGIKDRRSAELALASGKALADLTELVPPVILAEAVKDSNQTSIVAGRGLDLSGELACDAPECRIRQANELFFRVWHYFDNIFVNDAVSQEFRTHAECGPSCLRESLPGHIEILLYLREVGADSLVTFVSRRPACLLHWRRHAKEVGLVAALDRSGEIVSRLAGEAEVVSEETGKATNTYVFRHPDFEHSVWVSLDHSRASKMTDRKLRMAVAHSVLQRYGAHLASDLWVSQRTGAPLGSVLALHRVLLQERPPTVQRTAFEVDLPVLQNVRVNDLLRLRNDNRDLFGRFQANLRLAISERLRQQPTRDDATVAEEIQRDLIEPDLRKIRQKLAASERLLSQKSMVSIGVGVLTTVVGLLSGVAAPLAATAGVGTIVTTGATHLNKYFEERRDIAESDYYFLWRASHH